MKTCCFSANLELPPEQMQKAKRRLRKELDQAIADGYTRFLCSMSPGLELYIARALVRRQREDPKLSLEVVLCRRRRLWELANAASTWRLLKACAAIYYPDAPYDPGMESRCLQYLVGQADRVVAVYNGNETSPTALVLMLAYVYKKEIHRIRMPGAGQISAE